MVDLALSAGEALFAALESTMLKEVSMVGYESKVKELRETVFTIKKVLLEAETQRQLSLESQDYIERLKDVVYDAEDLFDELRTMAELEQDDEGNKLSKKVSDFFFSKNSLFVAYKTSKEVKKMKNNLEAIASDPSKFSFNFDCKPIRERREKTCSYVYSPDVIGRRREETCSYVYSPDVTGREDDTKATLNLLLESEVQENVGFLSVVGVGGLGKTTLAQLVYHDNRVKNQFALRLWVFVSDQDGEKFDVKGIHLRILDSAGYKLDSGSSMERVLSTFQDDLYGKKSLLVLDDIWNEDRHGWLKLRGFLM